MNLSAFFILTVSLLSINDAYRILGVFPFNGPSHMIMFEELMKGLAKKGHQVDVVSEFPLKNPISNYTHIHFESGLPKMFNNFTFTAAKTMVMSPVKFIGNVAGNLLCEKLGTEPIQKIVKNPPKNPSYDLLITEAFGAHCYMAIGHLLNIPVIAVSSADMYPWLNQLIAAPENIALFPNTVIDDYVEHMDFWWRLYNTVYTAYNVLNFNYITNVQDTIIKRHLGPAAPSYEEVISNVALVLVNNHVTISGVRDTTPALIDVGGLHIKNVGPPLPKNVEKWVNESDGFIYFSFGSMIKIESLSQKTLDVIYKSIKKISPTRVLMKIAAPEELPPGLPNNVLTAQWLPQTTVLKHPKVKAFITHGGLLGTQEAIYFGVPMIGLPIFADQFRNVHMGVAKKISIYLDIDKLSQENLDAALHNILNNPEYRKSAKQLSNQFKDRPQNPLDTAIYWTEYIIKHGSKSLRSPAMELTWYQRALLDVYLCLFAIVLLVIGAVIKITEVILKSVTQIDNKNSQAKKIN